MKSIKLNFSHPFDGRARLFQSSDNAMVNINVEQDEFTNDIEIPLTHCKKGFWKLVLDWEFEGRSFSYQQTVEILAEGIITF